MRWSTRARRRRAARIWQQLKNWHLWLAWYPVDVGDGDWRWLERVERRIVYRRRGTRRYGYRSPQ